MQRNDFSFSFLCMLASHFYSPSLSTHALLLQLLLPPCGDSITVGWAIIKCGRQWLRSHDPGEGSPGQLTSPWWITRIPFFLSLLLSLGDPLSLCRLPILPILPHHPTFFLSYPSVKAYTEPELQLHRTMAHISQIMLNLTCTWTSLVLLLKRATGYTYLQQLYIIKLT